MSVWVFSEVYIENKPRKGIPSAVLRLSAFIFVFGTSWAYSKLLLLKSWDTLNNWANVVLFTCTSAFSLLFWPWKLSREIKNPSLGYQLFFLFANAIFVSILFFLSPFNKCKQTLDLFKCMKLLRNRIYKPRRKYSWNIHFLTKCWNPVYIKVSYNWKKDKYHWWIKS